MDVTPTDSRMTSIARAICLACWLCCCRPSLAHEGPPYPILVDEPVNGYLVSVWGDPDVGTGTFYVIFESDDSSREQAALPRVDIWVQPVTGRLEKVTYPAHIDRPRQFRADPGFDREETWSVGIVMQFPAGQTRELVTSVEVTPPGYGRWDLVIYLVPFLLFGGLWCLSLLKRWRTPRSVGHARMRSSASAGAPVSP
jgi:hypothetical protein